MKIIIITVITLSTFPSSRSAEKVSCGKDGDDNLDHNIQKMYLFGAPDRKYPTNDEEMRTFCSDNFAMQNQVKTYTNNCLNNLSKQVLSLLMYSINKYNNNICKSPKRKREFLKSGQCANAAKTDTIKCWSGDFIRGMDGIRYFESDKLKLPLSCCNMLRFKACATKAYESKPRKCGHKEIEALDNMFDAYAIETMRLLCGDFNEDSDKCDTIIGKIPESKLKTLPKSPVESFIKILESIKSK